MTETTPALLTTLEGVYTGRVRPVKAYRQIAPLISSSPDSVRLTPEDARLAADACRYPDNPAWSRNETDRLLEIAQTLEDQL